MPFLIFSAAVLRTFPEAFSNPFPPRLFDERILRYGCKSALLTGRTVRSSRLSYPKPYLPVFPILPPAHAARRGFPLRQTSSKARRPL